MKKTMLMAAGLVLATGAQASVTDGGYSTARFQDGYLLIDMSGDGPADKPACHTNETWDYRITGPEGTNAMIRAVAEHPYHSFRIIGTGECSGGIETVRAVRLMGRS